MNEHLTFFDTDFISSFLRIDRMDLILNKYGQISISTEVNDELKKIKSFPLLKQRFDNLMNTGNVKIYKIKGKTEEMKIYFQLCLESEDEGLGELSVISLAKAKNGILASNNLRDVCKSVNKFNLTHITTATTLVELYDEKLISLDEVKRYWRIMNQFKIKLPSVSFDEFYEKHGTPCEDFYNNKFQ